MNSFKMVVLVSGSGSNLQAIIDAVAQKKLPAKIEMVISNREDAYALTRAKNAGIEASVISQSDDLLNVLHKIKPDLIVLAGYLSILPAELVAAYAHKIINIHPSLLPLYGGKGFYGLKVHEAVIQDHQKTTGATVHFVDAGIDTGEIIMQQAIDVLPDDTPQSLQQRVLKVEHDLLVKSIASIMNRTSGSRLKDYV